LCVGGSEGNEFGDDFDGEVMLAILFEVFIENLFESSPQKSELLFFDQFFPL